MESQVHKVLGTPLNPPYPGEKSYVLLGMGNFHESEKIFWETPGVYTTIAGFSGGEEPHPTYELPGDHAMVVKVVYDQNETTLLDIFAKFWESHNPTLEVPESFKSCIYCYFPQEMGLAHHTWHVFQGALNRHHKGEITTDIGMAGKFIPADHEEEQFLHDHPVFDPTIHPTGVPFPFEEFRDTTVS